jgi:hypothetical protein
VPTSLSNNRFKGVGKPFRYLCSAVLLLPVLTAGAQNQPFTDPSGFSVNLPAGWEVQKFQQGFVRMHSADGQRFVLLLPILGRSTGCATMLQRAFASNWAAFPGARDTEISAVPGSRGTATARFSFRDGRSRGAVLCAETSAGTAMFYGLAAPAESFAQQVPVLVGVLRSFRYAGGSAAQGSRAPSAPVTLPRMATWQEPREMAFTMQVPEGWRVSGGLTRLDASHAASGVEVASPDGQAVVRFGDARLPTCTIPGPGMAQMGSSGGLTLCPYRTGRQAGEVYLQRTLAREWGIEGVQVMSSTDRPEMSQAADRGPAQFGLNVRNAFAEIHFRGSRRGAPVEGWMLANTQMMASVGGQNFILGTYSTLVNAFMAPPARVPELAAVSGHMAATTRWSVEWYQREQRIGIELARKTLAVMHAQGEQQQRDFWARMDASDRRRDAVNDILGGTVRLSDGEGHQYDAKAGSNYYFLDQNEARRAGRPNDAVVGGDVYPAPLVDLKPLEVIR